MVDTAMIKLFYRPSSANLAPHFLLQELGIPYELVLVDRATQAQQEPAYLALNPTGRIPVFVDGDLVVFETAAIVMHLVDTHPQAMLAPPVGSPERSIFYQWLMYLTNTLQAESYLFFYPERYTSDPAQASNVKNRAEQRWTDCFALVERQLSKQPPYLLGEQFSALDLYLAMMVRWGRVLPSPPRLLPHLGRHAELVFARPAVVRAMEAEGLTRPFY